MTRLVCISDTHLQHDFTVPEGDILLHAGDATFNGKMPEVIRFAQWYASMPHKHKVFVAGNHDWGFQKDHNTFKSILQERGITYLQDNRAFLGGLVIYGSPWQPEFCNWAFNLPRCGPDLHEKWSQIPEDTDVLITHGPPKGILDKTLPYDGRMGQEVGCYDLRERVKQLPDLRLHVFGHIHPGYGSAFVGNTRFVNASICNEDYKPVNAPVVVEL